MPPASDSLVKICGLSTPDTLAAALEAGADWVGFVHFPRSPRHVSLETGASLARQADGRARCVLLLVDPDDAEVDAAVGAIGPDLVQLHGRESPERVVAVRARTGLPVVKAVGIATAADLASIGRYRGRADVLLLDAKAPAGAALPGGNGRSFDWSLLGAAALDPALPLMLSGGLDPDNVARAIAVTGLSAVDVSSGVESRPGHKDPDRIASFIRAARQAFAAAAEHRRVA